MGLVVLLLLSAAVVFSSCALVRGFDLGEGDRKGAVIAGAVLAHVLIIVPIFVLGSLGVLSALTLGTTVGALSALAIVVVVRRDGGPGAFLRHQRDDARRFLSWPRELVSLCQRSDVPLWPLLVAVFLLLCWMGFATLVSPPDGNNDAVFYHEPIVAMTIQHGHLGPYDLPKHLQRINGMPRFCHFMQLWFAIFTGRTFVELPNVISHPVAILCTFGLLRKVGVHTRVALLWALCWTMTPGLVRLTSGIMVDVHTSALVLMAMYAALLPRLTAGRALVAAAAIGLTVGTKYHVIVVTFVLAVVLLIRLLACRRRWTRSGWWATTVASAAIVIGAVCSHYLRNSILFDNPIWPGGVRIPLLGLDLPSADDLKNVATSGKGLPALEVIDRWLSAPFSRRPWAGSSAAPEDYGVGGLYLAWPLALLATLRTAKLVARRIRRRRRLPPSLAIMSALTSLIVVGLLTFPSPVRGRYWLVILGAFYVAAAWYLTPPRRRRVGKQLAYVMSLLMMLSVLWTFRIPWVATPAAVWHRLNVPAGERDFTDRPLSHIKREAGLVRLREMTAGTVIGFDTGYSIGILWNDDYSNRVVWLGHRDPVGRAEALEVDFLFLERRTLAGEKKDPRRWDMIGPALERRGRHPGRLYRRVQDRAAAGDAREETPPP